MSFNITRACLFPFYISDKPFCKPTLQSIYGASSGHTVDVLCGVHSNPGGPRVSFEWRFNSSNSAASASSSSSSSSSSGGGHRGAPGLPMDHEIIGEYGDENWREEAQSLLRFTPKVDRCRSRQRGDMYFLLCKLMLFTV